jgi:protein-arginine kinase activator protein McsA
MVVCPGCGKNFERYKNSTQKHCSFDCYITARFGEVPTP